MQKICLEMDLIDIKNKVYVTYGFITNKFFLIDITAEIPIGLVGRVFANGPGDRRSIAGRVIPKTQKNGTWCLLA